MHIFLFSFFGGFIGSFLGYWASRLLFDRRRAAAGPPGSPVIVPHMRGKRWG